MPDLSFLLLCLSFLAFQTTAQKIITTTITTAAPSITTIGPSPKAASPQYTNPSDLQSAVLNSTNTYRNQHNATALAWNASLASYAKSHVSACQFEHTHGPYGENLAQGYQNVTAAIEAWGDERDFYDFDIGRFSKEIGHFTQLVWKKTSSTGCAVKECGDSGWLLFCEYWPQGNVVGEFVKEVQQMVKGSEEANPSPPKSTPIQTDVAKEGGVRGYVIYLHGKINGAGGIATERRICMLIFTAMCMLLLL